MGSEQHLVGRISVLHIEGVGLEPARVSRRSVESIEVVPGQFDFGSRCYLIAKPYEDIDDFVDRLSEYVMHSQSRLVCFESHIDPVLFEESVLGGTFEHGAPTVDQSLQLRLNLR